MLPHIIVVRVIVGTNVRPLGRPIFLPDLQHDVDHFVQTFARDKLGDAITPQLLNAFAQRAVNTSAVTVGHLGHTVDLGRTLFGDRDRTAYLARTEKPAGADMASLLGQRQGLLGQVMAGSVGTAPTALVTAENST